jgi:hypothetical protein
LGDVNLDYEFDLSDPVALLEYLFAGKGVLCLEASDYNRDGTVDISDPISMLDYLFRGAMGPGREDIFCAE